jgi:hypothetical protein
MPTGTLTHQQPTELHAACEPAADAVIWCDVTCECGYRDHDNPGDDPTDFLTKSLAHLEARHPDVFHRLIGLPANEGVASAQLDGAVAMLVETSSGSTRS